LSYGRDLADGGRLQLSEKFVAWIQAAMRRFSFDWKAGATGADLDARGSHHCSPLLLNVVDMFRDFLEVAPSAVATIAVCCEHKRVVGATYGAAVTLGVKSEEPVN
jgi:hypothetical protein